MMKKPKSLRSRMMGAIFFSLLLLWGIAMVILCINTTSRIESQTNARMREQARLLQSKCREVIDGTAPEENKRAILEYYLSGEAGGLKNIGGADVYRLYAADESEIARTQLAYGYAQNEDGSVYYYLSMDQGLDDEGLLGYLEWVIAHQSTDGNYGLSSDGTVAVIAGVVKHNRIAVQRLALRHPDSSVEVILEAPKARFEGELLTTQEFPELTLDSGLLPTVWSNGEKQWSENVDLKALLKKYRTAEAQLDAFYAENSAPTYLSSSDGRVEYMGTRTGGSLASSWDNSGNLLAHEELLRTYIFTLLAALTLGFLLSKYLSHKLAVPLEELGCTVAEGRPCVETGPITEVNALATAFNAAQMKMANDLKREQDLTRAVAHELKTPLAILRSHAEALSEDIDPAKRSAYLNIIMDESDRMAALVGELLDLSRMEAGAERLNREVVDLKALTQRVFAPLEHLARVSLTLEHVLVSGDPKLLERAVSNYASNALRHCAEGGEIRVTLRREGGSAVLTVENDGDHIPPEALPHLWDTFYKADTARTRTGGTGLGLAIVRSIATLHGGSCAAENRPGAVAFTLTLSCIPTDSVV